MKMFKKSNCSIRISILLVFWLFFTQKLHAQLDSVRGYLIFSSESIKQAYATKVSVNVYDVYQREILSLKANESGYFAFKLADSYQDSVIEVNASCRIFDHKKIDSICPCVYNLNCRGFFDSRTEILRSKNQKSTNAHNVSKDFNSLISLSMKEAFCPLDTSYFYLKDQMVDTNRSDFKMKLNCLDQKFLKAMKTKKEKLVVYVSIDTSNLTLHDGTINLKFIDIFLNQFARKYGQFEVKYIMVEFYGRKKEESLFFVNVSGH